jgi:CheY-like chemotaxis protein
VRLSVRDDGAGMTRETRARVFDPFFTTRPEGNGLGLAIVHRIVSAHGGAIEVESEPGAGALFRVWLPAARGGQVETRPPERSRDPATPRRRVLFVDDEPSIVALAGRALRRFGCEVTGCSEPLRALDLLRQAPLAYDVLVTDASMPGIGGFELVRAARSLHPDLPVLVQSGNVRSEDQAEAKALAVDGLLQKPCAAEQLAAAIENALRSRAALRPGSPG